MENVPGMLTIGEGRVVDEIKAKLRSLGYQCQVRIVYCEDFGVPQARRRAFVIASRIGAVGQLFPRGTHGPSEKPSVDANALVHRWTPPGRSAARPFVTVWDAIGDLPVLKNGGGTARGKHRKAPVTRYQRRARGRATQIHNHVCHALSKAMLKRISHVYEGGNWTQIPRRLLPAGMRRAERSDHTKRYGRLRRRGLASTILTKCDPHWGAYVHPTQNRTVSVREAARLQGFPDRFRFAGTHASKHYEQVGNAVPVQVAHALGVALAAQVRTDRRRRNRARAALLSPAAAAMRVKSARQRRMRFRRRQAASTLRMARRRFALPCRRQVLRAGFGRRSAGLARVARG
jgi:DNA (cytosine-5)-methyltransferase 1